MSATTLVAVLVLGVPALAFALWPLVRRGGEGGRAFLALPVDPRQELEEEKRAALRALRELEFEHDAGHISDEDYAGLRARYEQEAAAVLAALDRLGPAAPRARAEPAAPALPAATLRGWRHPLALGASAVVLLVFGAALGVGIVRYTEPDLTAAAPAGGAPMPPFASPGTGSGPLPPEVLQGMLRAARAALLEGQYTQAMAAYQAVLGRDPKNVDAITHLGLILAIGGGAEHADRALEAFDRALALDPNYPPALLYRGQVLYDVKKDVPGALRAWEKFVALAPAGEDRDRVEKLLREAKARR
ncbi:MAG: hypothetical protein A3D33_10450 [Candidatus Rokubacteria bacterium RIFCSPHIGHO2_02_FULL_73_26]|nr:MAG: hypothetical protein A3D33_10450 [Candidatus Rokubacteria bacterium RIFCSPHIGHO2_02_FULL_73_26]